MRALTLPETFIKASKVQKFWTRKKFHQGIIVKNVLKMKSEDGGALESINTY